MELCIAKRKKIHQDLDIHTIMVNRISASRTLVSSLNLLAIENMKNIRRLTVEGKEGKLFFWLSINS